MQGLVHNADRSHVWQITAWLLICTVLPIRLLSLDVEACRNASNANAMPAHAPLSLNAITYLHTLSTTRCSDYIIVLQFVSRVSFVLTRLLVACIRRLWGNIRL